MREEAQNLRKVKYLKNKNANKVVSAEEEEAEESDDEGEEFVEKKRRKQKKENSVTVQIPTNIVKILAPTATRYDVSSTALTTLLLKTVTAGGGDIDNLPLSRRQVERTSKQSINKYADDIKEAFKAGAKDKLFVVHFDGKQIQDFTGGVKRMKERLSVLVSSPSLEHGQVLGALALDGQTGDQIFQGVMSLLLDFGVAERIIGMSFDTTASNTGVRQGACARLETHLKKALLWLACRRHVLELHIKHVAQVAAETISDRRQTGPTHTVFKRMQDRWPELVLIIDMDNLHKINWNNFKGTEIEDQAEKALATLSKFLKEKNI